MAPFGAVRQPRPLHVSDIVRYSSQAMYVSAFHIARRIGTITPATVAVRRASSSFTTCVGRRARETF